MTLEFIFTWKGYIRAWSWAFQFLKLTVLAMNLNLIKSYYLFAEAIKSLSIILFLLYLGKLTSFNFRTTAVRLIFFAFSTVQVVSAVNFVTVLTFSRNYSNILTGWKLTNELYWTVLHKKLHSFHSLIRLIVKVIINLRVFNFILRFLKSFFHCQSFDT